MKHPQTKWNLKSKWYKPPTMNAHPVDSSYKDREEMRELSYKAWLLGFDPGHTTSCSLSDLKRKVRMTDETRERLNNQCRLAMSYDIGLARVKIKLRERDFNDDGIVLRRSDGVTVAVTNRNVVKDSQHTIIVLPGHIPGDDEIDAMINDALGIFK